MESNKYRALLSETFESRRLLAGDTSIWGIHLDSNTDWAAHGAWVDVTRALRRWGDVNSPWEEGNFSLDPTDQGIPREDAGALSELNGYTGGTYKLSYEGTGTITFRGLAELDASTLQTVDGVTTADVIVGEPDGQQILHLMLRDVDPNDPVRNLTLIAPGYSTDQTFRSEFTHRLQPFQTLRFMDWANTNNSLAVDWAERRLPEEMIQTTGFGDATKGGVAWEHMISLANLTGKDAWINVPHQANADYIRNLAKLWKENLDPNLNLIVEYSNENWNSLFNQAQDGQWNYYDSTGPRVLEMSQIFREEFGTDPRLEIVLAGQSANTHHVLEALRYFREQGYEPSGIVDAIAIAPYFQAPHEEAYDNLDDLFANVEQQIDAMVEHQEIAEYYDLKMYAYEAGQHLVPGNTPLELIQEAQNDPRMADAYRDLDKAWKQAGGELIIGFSLASKGGKSGFWGALEDIRDPGSTKWDTLLSLALNAGDTSLDGKVTFEDFEVLAGNFGQSGLWWEQGDFDGDSDVDGSDFELMLPNLLVSDFSEAQFDDFYEFAAANELSVPVRGAPVLTAVVPERIQEGSAEPTPIVFDLVGATSSVDVHYRFTSYDNHEIADTFDGVVTIDPGASVAELPFIVYDDQVTQSERYITFEVLDRPDYFRNSLPLDITVIDNDETAFVHAAAVNPAGNIHGQPVFGGTVNFQWEVQNDDLESYQFDSTKTLYYENLIATGGHLYGGDTYHSSGVALADQPEFFSHQSLSEPLIGRDRQTLWMSFLVQRDELALAESSPTRIALNTSNTAWYENERDVAVGFFGADSIREGEAYWSLEVNGQVHRSDVPVQIGKTALMVVRVDYGENGDTVSLYANPTELGGAEPSTTSVQVDTEYAHFSNMSFYAGKVDNPSRIDEIRFGHSYATVTPVWASGGQTSSAFSPNQANFHQTEQPIHYEGEIAAGPLHGALGEATHFNDAGWVVQGGKTNPNGYRIVDGDTLAYGELATTDGYIVGGQRYLAAGRKLGSLNEFRFNNSNDIGRDNSTLWFSVLVQRNEDVLSRKSSPTRVSLNASKNTPWFDQERVVSVGYFGEDSLSEGQGFWSLELDGVVHRTNVPIVTGETALLVVRMDFSSDSDTVALYVNPSQVGGEAPSVPDIQATTADIRFRNLSYYAGNRKNVSAIDELRFGASFAAVTPSATPIEVTLDSTEYSDEDWLAYTTSAYSDKAFFLFDAAGDAILRDEENTDAVYQPSWIMLGFGTESEEEQAQAT